MSNIIRVRTRLEYGLGSPGLMTNYFRTPSETYADSDAQLGVDRVRDALAAGTGLFPPALTFRVLGDVDVLDDVNGDNVNHLVATERTFNGTGPGGLGPLAVGLLMRLKTDAYVDGRRLVGRTYFVPIAGSLTTAPVVPSSMTDALKAIGDALMDTGVATLVPVIWSRPRPATAVGPHRPAGRARDFRAGSSAEVSSASGSTQYVVMTSRRD
jgi:hypothetical protein